MATQYMLVYTLFGFFWVTLFFTHLAHTVVIAAICQWYWAKDKENDIGAAPVLTAWKKVLRYHLGTIAFGSCIVAIVRTIRYCLYAVKKYANADNAAMKVIWYCIDCCLRCFERCLEFISKNAYIITCMESKSFCPAAKQALQILVLNAARVGAVNTVSSFFMFIGKLFICSISVFVCATILSNDYYSVQISSIVPSCFIAGCFCWMLASTFLGIYDVCVDTIFLCFCVDEDKKLGFAEGSLKEFIDANKGGEKAAEPQAV